MAKTIVPFMNGTGALTAELFLNVQASRAIFFGDAPTVCCHDQR